ncbi:hypothetical protein [Halobellus captivus]|uniref:hypothetical protein n=1 Tax=Halobellus captivus TaxID=2592614 RepID=UPI0011AA6B84|nr:hypothetical protein [Halobellus captivus]
MSYRSHGRNLSEWADLIGASLPDSVEERENASAGFDADGRFSAEDGFGANDGFGERSGDEFDAAFGSRSNADFVTDPDS